MVSVGELLVILIVYWKQCLRMGGSDWSLLYTEDTSTLRGPVTVLERDSTTSSISPRVTSSSPGRRGLPPAASAAAASRALAALPPLFDSPELSSGPPPPARLAPPFLPSPSFLRRAFLTSSCAALRAFCINSCLELGASGYLPRISLARSRFFFRSSSSSPIILRMVRSRRSLASFSSFNPGFCMSSSYSSFFFSSFLIRSAIMARPRATRSRRISSSTILAARAAEMPMS
mmetsp:Transcript_21314/g.46558  ORF Transcript_21314/g.46558 Transcript_21314/m.46558 type:complete len:232 (+) Transcript_21314:417-1112(+)